MRTRGRILRRGEIERSVTFQIILAIAIITLALSSSFSALIPVSLTRSHRLSPTPSLLSLSNLNSELGAFHSVMVVRFVCMGCQGGQTGPYFTTYQAAAVHYARSATCHQSPRGIATVVLPNRPGDAEAGGSGAAGGWVGPSRLASGSRARPRPSMTGTRKYTTSYTIYDTYHIRYSIRYRMTGEYISYTISEYLS